MKKKAYLLSTLLLILLSALILTSCTIFSVNKERIENEPIISISYDGQNVKVTKKELQLAAQNEVNRQLYSNPQFLYIMQIAPQYAEAFKLQVIQNVKNNIVEIIAKEKIQTLIAKKEFSSDNPNKDSFDILLDWEKQYVIDSLNDEIINQYIAVANNAYSAYLVKIQSEESQKNTENVAQKEIEQNPELKPREFGDAAVENKTIKRIPNEAYVAVNNDWKSQYFTTMYGDYGSTDQNKILSNSNKLITFINANKNKNQAYLNFSKITTEYLELKAKADKTQEEETKLNELTLVFKDAYLDTIKIFKEKSYNSLLDEISSKELIARYNDKLTNKLLAENYKNEVNAAYEKTINASSTKWKLNENGTTLKSLIEASDNLFIHPMFKYFDKDGNKKMTSAFGVQSIRFAFNEKQKAALNLIGGIVGYNTQKYYQARQYLAFADESMADDIKKLVNDQNVEKGIKVYISNLDFNNTLEISKENTPYELDMENTTDDKLVYKAYDFKQILKMISQDMKSSDEKVNNEFKNAPANYKNKKNTEIVSRRLSTFEKWINKVNDNKNMFAKDGKFPVTFVTMEGSYKNSDFTKLSEETIALARNVFKNNVNSEYIASSMNAAEAEVAYEANDSIKFKIYNDADSNISYVLDDEGINLITVSNYGIIPEKNNFKYYSKEGKVVEDASKVDEILFAVLNLDAKTNGNNSFIYSEVLKENYINSLLQEKLTEIIKEEYKKAKITKNDKKLKKVIDEIFPTKKK